MAMTGCSGKPVTTSCAASQAMTPFRVAHGHALVPHTHACTASDACLCQRGTSTRSSTAFGPQDAFDVGVHKPLASINFSKRLLAEVQRDRVSNAAAALAFYMMLAVFPAAIFGLSLLPYLPIPHLSEAIFDLLQQLMPDSAAQLFTGTVHRIASERNSGLLSFGLLFAIWSASSGVNALMQQLNVVYGVEEDRSFLRARAVALLLTLLFFVLTVVAFGLVIFGGVLQSWLADYLGWSPVLRAVFAVFRWAVIALALVSALALVYRLAPNAKHPMRILRAGEIVAALGFLGASLGFKLYVAYFGSYDSTYGSLGAVIVLLLWMFIVGFVILLGGEINDMLYRERHAENKPSGASGEQHERDDAAPTRETSAQSLGQS